MLIDKYECRCSRCNSTQLFYYHNSGNSKYAKPVEESNVCSVCGNKLTERDVLNWDKINEFNNGARGEEGIE